MPKIEVRNLTKIFGRHPSKGLALVRARQKQRRNIQGDGNDRRCQPGFLFGGEAERFS